MRCDEARKLIQSELDGAVIGDDDRFGVSASPGGAETLELERHCAGCPACAALSAELRAIHSALIATAVESAPAWLPTAVMAEVERASVAGRLEPVLVTAGAAAGIAAMVTTLLRTGVLSGASSPLARVGELLAGWFGGLSSTVMTSPGVEAVHSSQPGGIVFGAVWMVAAIVSFLALSGLRLSKELSLDTRRALSR